MSPAYGWANQLHNEPTFDIAFERRWRTARRVVIEDHRLEVDFIPRVGASLGNVAIYADVGGTARIGKNLRDDFGPTRARPSLPGSEAFIGDGSFGWYLFAGVDGQAVGRNIFLDGNTDGASLRVSHRPFVAEAQAGLAVTWRGVRVAYTQVLRSPDFYEQGRWTQFGSAERHVPLLRPLPRRRYGRSPSEAENGMAGGTSPAGGIRQSRPLREQDDQDDHDEAGAAAGVVTPATAVWPCRQGTDQDQDQE